MKIFVAIPARVGRICAATTISLMNEKAVAELAGVELQLGIVPGCSAPHFARDQLVRDFLATDAERLVFVDDDVSWEAGSLIKLAAKPVDLVGGAYRFKQDEEAYPVQWLPNKYLLGDPETGLLQVMSLPGGFMAIGRRVFEELKAAHPERAYSHMGHDLHGFFCMPYGGGEDTQFCMDWQKISGRVWLDPELALTHHGGSKSYAGHIGDWLRARSEFMEPI